MKIAIFSDSFLPYICGVTTSIINQANELTRRGHEVRIYRPKPSSDGEARATLSPKILVRDLPVSVPSVKFPDLNFAFPMVLPSFRSVRDFDPDIFHTHTEWGCGWEGLILSRLLRKPLVSTFNTFYADPGYLEHFHLPVASLARETVWRYLMTFYNRCHAIISPSESALDELANRRLKAKSYLIANGVEAPPAIDEATIAERRRKLGLSEGVNFVYVGRLGQEKSLEIILRAFKKISGTHPTSKFVLIGDGPHRAEITREIHRLELGDRVVDLGMTPHDRLIREHIPRVGDVFVTASKTENHPISVLEALVFGLPVIGAKARGIPELISDGGSGFLFPPDDVDAVARRMSQLIQEPATLKTMSENARIAGQSFLIPHVADQLERVYEEALRGADRARAA